MNKEKLYITTTETLYPSQTDFDSVVVRLYGRTKDYEMKTVTVKGFQPYFLTRKCDSDKVAVADYEDLIEYEDVTDTPLSERWQTDQTDLVKVNVKFPHSVKVLRQEFDRTWGADCIFTERFRIDSGIKTGVEVPTHTTRGDHIIVDVDELEPVPMKDVEPRVLTLDIETDDRDAGFPDPGEARILSIAIHDSYTDQYEVFLDLDGEDFRSFFDLNAVEKAKLANNELELSDIEITEPDKLIPEASEKQMFTAFSNRVKEIDPDLIAGWNCLPGDTKIQMADGSESSLKNVDVGDKIIGTDGNEGIETAVERKFSSYKNSYEISTSNGSIEASEDHKVMVRRDGEYEWITVEELSTGDNLVKLRNHDIEAIEPPKMVDLIPLEDLRFSEENQVKEIKSKISDEVGYGYAKKFAEYCGINKETVYHPKGGVWSPSRVKKFCESHGINFDPREYELEEQYDTDIDTEQPITKDFLYKAGLIMSDGSIEENGSASFYNTKEDLHKQFDSNPHLMSDGKGSYSQNVLTVSEARAMQSLGVPQGNKNENGAILKPIYNLPESFISQFIAGVIDGDGCVRKSGHINISAKHDTTAKWYKRLLKRLGINSRLVARGIRVTGAAQDMERVVNWILPKMNHERKCERLAVGTKGGTSQFSSSDDRFTVPVRSITEVGEKEMYDITTGSHNFVANGYVVHNCGDSSNDGFDMPHIIKRMKNVGASAGRLSREREVEVDHHGDDFEPSVTGRALYDLMDGWGDTKFTEPDSFKLDDVAQDALGDAKIEHQEQGYFEMYDEDPVKFVNYNVKDTRLTVQVNEAENVLGFKKRLKDMVGVDWRRTHQNNEFIEMSVRRKCFEHKLAMITAYDNKFVANAGDGVNYEGAYVFPSFSGVRMNVCGVDLASLYPMTQWMLNASPDARIEVKKGTEEWYELKEEINGQYAEAANGQMFRTDHDGIIRELVDEYHEIKKEFKAERNAAEYGTEAWEEAAEAYSVTKTIYNSFYGYSGWARSPLYNPHDAAAITLTGQEVIKATAQFISDKGADGVEVVYGDTDSNYVQFPDDWEQEETLEYAENLCQRLESEVYPKKCDDFNIPREDNRWEIEVEMRAKRFFMSDRKKAYAYLKMWDEGDDFDAKINDGDGKFDVTGYDCVKSNFSKLTKNLQESVLEKIIRGGDKNEIVKMVYEAAASIDADNPDWDRLGVPQGLGQNIDPEKSDEDGYYSWSTTGDHPRGEAPRAAWFANHLLDIEFARGDKPKRAKVRPGQTVNGEQVDVIAYESYRDLIGVDLQIDPSEAQRKCIKNPMEDILDAFGVEPEAALRGKCQTQSGLDAFF